MYYSEIRSSLRSGENWYCMGYKTTILEAMLSRMNVIDVYMGYEEPMEVVIRKTNIPKVRKSNEISSNSRL